MYVNNCCFINCYFTSLHVLLAPSRITNVTVSKDVRQGEPILRVNWTAPQSDVNLSRYQVQYKWNGTAGWSSQVTVTPPETTAILSDLTAGTAYSVRVRAVSDAGNGEWSEVLTETTYNSEFKCYQFHISYSCYKPLSNAAGKQRLSNCILPVTRQSGLRLICYYGNRTNLPVNFHAVATPFP